MSKCLCAQLAPEGCELSATCLGNLWVFEELAAEDLQALASEAQRRVYAKGEAIFRQGEPAARMFLLKGGRVKLSRVSEDGAEITLDIRKAGDFLGESMLTEEEEFPLSAICIEDTLTCGFTRPGFESLVLAHPNLGLTVIRNLSRRINWLTSRVDARGTSNLEERLHRVLVQVAKEHGRRGRKGLVLDMPLTHEELSFLVGAHRVSITRAMKVLKETGRLSQEGRSLIVTQSA